MSTIIPAGRIQLAAFAGRQYAALLRLSGSIELDQTLRELIDVRVSQINGCAFCLDMHWKDARAAGVSEERLYMLDAWRESPLYDDRERAALALCRGDPADRRGGIPEPVWDQAEAGSTRRSSRRWSSPARVINAWNRLSIAARAEPGPLPARHVRRRRRRLDMSPAEVIAEDFRDMSPAEVITEDFADMSPAEVGTCFRSRFPP